MNEDKKQFMRVVAWIGIAAFFILLSALAVVYSRNIFGAVDAVWRAFFPLVLGCVFAFLLNLIMSRLEPHYFPGSDALWVKKTRRPLCLLASVAIIALIITAIVSLVIPELRHSIGVIEQGLRVVASDVYVWLVANIDLFEEVFDPLAIKNLEQTVTDFVLSFTEGLKNGDGHITDIMGSFFSTVGGIAHGIFAFIVAVVFSIYLLLEKTRAKRAANGALDVLFSTRVAHEIRRVCRVAYLAFSRFITGQCIEAVILGTLCAIGMTLLGMPYAASIGACVGSTALVPVFGAWLGGIVGFLMILTVDPLQAVWFVVFLIILQQFETHLIYPFVVGASVGVPGIWVFSSVLVGGALFGLIGMFLGVPAVATIRTLLIQYGDKVREKKGLPPSDRDDDAGDGESGGGFGAVLDKIVGLFRDNDRVAKMKEKVNFPSAPSGE